MAFQNISSPRIYLNIPQFLASTGSTIDPIFNTLPVSASGLTTITSPSISGVTLNNPYVAILGHTSTSITLTGSTSTSIINGTLNGTIKPGFSIMDVYSMPTTIAWDGDASSILLGTYFDFPHSPDLKLSLSYDYSGIKETTTKGGNSISNKFYSGPPNWGSLGAWELGGTAAHAKSGRRIWDLSWSYLSDSSVFPDNAGLVNETTGDTALTLLEDDTIQRCLHLTQGSHLPFIFQSNTTAGEVKPDSFAICKFDMKKFSFRQTAPNMYSVKLKIREVW